MFDFFSRQGGKENCHNPELIGEPLKVEVNTTVPVEHLTALIVLGERNSSGAPEKFGVFGKNVNRIMFVSSKFSIVFYYSSISTVVHLALTMF